MNKKQVIGLVVGGILTGGLLVAGFFGFRALRNHRAAKNAAQDEQAPQE